MKKTVLKIFSTATTLIALFFIVFLILAAFGKVDAEEFNNTIVRTICLVLGGIFLGLSVVSQVILHLNEDAVKEIVLRSGKEGTARTSLAVVKKIAKTTVKDINGVKCTKCAVISNDYGIRLRVWIKVNDRDMKETEDLVRACLEDAFWGALEFRFFAIDVNLKKIEAKHKVNKDAVKEKLEEKKPAEIAEETIANEPAEEVVGKESAPETENPGSEAAPESEIPAYEPVPEGETVEETNDEQDVGETVITEENATEESEVADTNTERKEE